MVFGKMFEDAAVRPNKYSVWCESQKCKKLHHFAAACKTGEWKKKREEKKKAAVKVVTMVETAPPAVAAVPAVPAVVAAAPTAGLNLVQVAPRPTYTFNPEIFSEITDGDRVATDF